MNRNKLTGLIDQARALALDLPPNSNRHLSFIFNKQRLISIGANYGKSHTETQRRGYGYSEVPHSELRAFMRVPYTQREDLVLVNFRFNKRGQLRISKPCRLCSNWCNSVFKHIYYTTDNGVAYANRRTNEEELIMEIK